MQQDDFWTYKGPEIEDHIDDLLHRLDTIEPGNIGAMILILETKAQELISNEEITRWPEKTT